MSNEETSRGRRRESADDARWRDLLARVRRFIRLDDDTLDLLARHAPLLTADAETFSQRFYDYLLSYPETSVLFERLGPDRLHELTVAQAGHLRGLIADWPETAGRSVGRVARAHYAHEVSPVWVAGGFSLYLDHLEARIRELPLEERPPLRSAVFRVLLADIMLQFAGFESIHNETMTERATISQALIETTLKLADLAAPEDVLASICTELVTRSRHLPAVWFGLIEDTHTPIRAYAGAGRRQLWETVEVDYDPADPLWRALDENRLQVLTCQGQAVPGWCAWRQGIEAVAIFPFGRVGGLRGVGVVYSDRSWYFDHIDLTPFGAFARLGQVLLGLKESHLRDPLTGLPNRGLFMDRLRHAMAQNLRRDRMLAVGMIDLDGFKAVNDRMGHPSGDALLREVATRVQAALRQGDTVARFGGDEFGLLLPDLRTIEEAEVVIERVQQAFTPAFHIHGEQVQVGASLGLTLYPLDDVDAQDLIRHADIALYQAKDAGRGVHRLFERDREDHLQRIDLLQREFLQAMARDELVLHYQPKVDMSTGEIWGVEVLVRWLRQGELRMPAGFIEAVEQRAPLIRQLGRHMLEAAASQIDHWLGTGRRWYVSVNIGAQHLLDPAFIEDVDEVLARHPAAAAWLQIEVTEQAALRDLESTRRALAACRARGLAVALDDYGTGHASLTYLQELPANQIKLDQRFVGRLLVEPRALAIIAGTLTSARLLDLDVVAEGVESVEQGELLLQLGCQVAQGYLISHPLPADALTAWADAWLPPPQWTGGEKSVWFTHEDLPLLMARTAHRYGVSQLLGALAVPRSEDHPMLAAHDSVDERHCSLSHWLDGAGSRHRHQPGFDALRQLHHALHEQAAAAVQAWQAGGRAELAHAVGALQQCAQTLDEALLDLVRRIAGGGSPLDD
ncbi:EAL domain-containing protein [Acidihalobacter prosperus]|uniref:Diguanylate cyclase DosC n=1 Tax=Acidihalobacter prosperus TaxID=160660 RepID=A0A1A6C497_9GAMM|nr:EAL domain-containing protein [Acidihalobacter prosperus]OBS09365.1 diguanylate cyclase/phosphodiesterase [Acidihalobacter prosperus]